MKKLLSVLLVLTMVVAMITGCSDSSVPANDGADWPKENITIIVPYPAGGSTDLTMRTLGEELSRQLGQNVVILNKEGGGGSVGASECANSKADGYTFTVANGANMSVVPRGSNIGYTYESFTPVAQVSNTPLALAVYKDFPADSLEEFIAWAKENPGDMRFSSAGANSTQQLTMDILGKKEDFQAVHIANNGAGPAVAACLGKHVEGVVALTTDLISGYESGELKVLTVFADQRSDSFPDVPCSKELGYDDLSFGVWYALVGPKGLPDAIINKMDGAVKSSLETDFIKDAYEKMKVYADYLNHDELAAKMKQVDDMFGSVLTAQ